MGLVLGGRGDATLVREGAERADISALFGIDDTLAAWLAACSSVSPGTTAQNTHGAQLRHGEPVLVTESDAVRQHDQHGETLSLLKIQN